MLAQRFSVSTETIRKWRKRGAHDCQDHSSRPHKLPWKASEEERAEWALRPEPTQIYLVTHREARKLPHVRAFSRSLSSAPTPVKISCDSA